MTGGPSRAVLRPGDWVSFEGGDHQVLAFAGTSVRLRAQDGSEQVVLASYLMAAPDFAVAGGIPVPGVEPFGLLDGLPEEVLAAARTGNATWWRWRLACHRTLSQARNRDRAMTRRPGHWRSAPRPKPPSSA